MVAGLAHMLFDYGYLLRAERKTGGKWELHRLAELPGRAAGFVMLGPDTFGVLSEGRLVVFNPDGILGLAPCVESGPPRAEQR